MNIINKQNLDANKKVDSCNSQAFEAFNYLSD
jgi:hypothetical protein